MPEESPVDRGREAQARLAALAGGDPRKAQELADLLARVIALPDDPADLIEVHETLVRVFEGRADPIDFVLEGGDAEEIVARFADFAVMHHAVTARLARALEEARPA